MEVRSGVAAQPLQAGPEQGTAVGVAVEGDIPLAEGPQQRVVEAADRPGRVVVGHPRLDGGVVDAAQDVAQLGERGDAELEQQPRDPRVVVGAGPAGLGELPGEEGREVRPADAWVVLVGLGGGAAGVAEALADRGELLVGELEQARGEGEATVEVGAVLLGDRALVADVVRTCTEALRPAIGPPALSRAGSSCTSRCRLE